MGKSEPEGSHNPTAKSIGRWENEGGAPKRPKRPRDPKQLTKFIVDMATGASSSPKTPANKRKRKRARVKLARKAASGRSAP
jgi:hypothetical protein